MNTAPSPRRTVVLSALLAFMLILLCGSIGLFVLTDPDIARAFILPSVALQIERTYSGQVDWNRMLSSARQAMFAELDRYSEFIEPEQFQQLDEEMTGGYSGIGVTVVKHEQGLLVMSVREDGPAAGVGLLTGDIITAADSVSLAGVDIQQASSRLRGPDGSSVLLTLYRPSTDDTPTIRVVRNRLSFLHIPFAGYTPENMIYIRLLDFDAGASTDLYFALDSLLNRTATKPAGVILDLKGNPGGLFSEAYQTASLFLDEGKFIVGTDARSMWNEETHRAEGRDITNGLPLAIIVDRGSASASEIVAGALKQAGRAVLVGDTTFGKGLVQGFTRFPDGSGVRLTISRYFLDGDLFLNEFDSTLSDSGTGLVPDYYVPSAERDPFVAAIERSLLLPEFAHLRQDEITAGAPLLGPDSTWAEQFAVYAGSHGFSFASPRTSAAQRVLKMAEDEGYSGEIIDAARRVLAISIRRDARGFVRFHDYLNMRLKQLAYERKEGTRSAYEQVIVHERPEIRKAVEVLTGDRIS